jgi:hypothetical protein
VSCLALEQFQAVCLALTDVSKKKGMKLLYSFLVGNKTPLSIPTAQIMKSEIHFGSCVSIHPLPKKIFQIFQKKYFKYLKIPRKIPGVYIQTFYVHAKFHDFFNGPGKKTILISKIATHIFVFHAHHAKCPFLQKNVCDNRIPDLHKGFF